MVIHRSLGILISKAPREARTFLTATTTATSSYAIPCRSAALFIANPFLQAPNFNRFLSPLSKWMMFSHSLQQGPLFLSSQPWKLSQSATPLHLRGSGAVVLRKVEALNLNLNLLRRRGSACPAGVRVGVGAGTVCLEPKWVDRGVSAGVSSEGFADSFVNLPNLISMSRLVSAPVLGWMIMNEWYSAAFVGLAFSGATDWLDGYVARKMNINSVVGSYLDPLADKVLIGCVAIAMVQKDLLPSELVGLVILRDVALVGGAVYKRASDFGWQWTSWSDFFNLNGTHREKVEPLFISKVNTVLQLALVAAALLQPEFGTQETQTYITYLSWLVASTMVASTAAYGVQYMRRPASMLRNQ